MKNQSEGNSKENFPLLGIGPKVLLCICPFFILFGILNSIYYPFFQIPINYYVLVIIGSILITIGIFVFIYSERIISSAHSSSELITKKTYAYVRHPMYASWGLGTLPGIFCLFNSWFLFLILIFYYLLFRIFVRKEERFLIEKYGEKYEHYKKNVNAFFPKLKKYKPD
ncbi:MAG: isoprenylcysteine carboxylmethyltransferase family protein [Promethearchaeota archaeon]|nr:MAG: isoprenylcysteine carboxylmethyltransferase family protein [Candidatus Lokiarchaeota archaeon]